MYLLYSLTTLVVLVLTAPYFVYQALRYRKYVGSLGQRLGYLPVPFNLDGDSSIWIQAVSVRLSIGRSGARSQIVASTPRRNR